jgi:hypothetical protein
MVREQYMIDKHAKATTFGDEEVVKEIVNEPSLEYPALEVQTEKGETTEISCLNSSSLAAEPFIVDNHYSMPSSYNHHPQESLVQHFSTTHIDDLEERVNQLMVARHAYIKPPHTYAPHQSCSFSYHPSHQDDCPFISHYVIEANKSAHEHAQTTTILVSEEKVVNKVEEKDEQIEPSQNSNLSNEKEVSTEAHSFITIHLETHHETQASFLQRLKVLSYAIIINDLCTEGHKSRNNLPKKIQLHKKVGYLRWRNILLEGYQVSKKKGWNGLIGHPWDWGRCGNFSFLFSTLYF